MALNPNTIKALFGKLVPYTDDIAKGVANYGDDAARLIANNADDAARLATNYGDDVADDVARLSAYVSKHNAKSLDIPLPVKTALQASEPDSLGFSNVPNQGVLSKLHDRLDDLPISPYNRYKADRTFYNAVDNAGWRGNTVPNVSYTNQLGPQSLHFADVGGGPGDVWYEFDPGTVGVPDIPRSGLVSTSKELRPHKNTALGRWYANAINNPSKRYVSDVLDIRNPNNIFDELSPGGLDLDDYYKGISFDDYLPF